LHEVITHLHHYGVLDATPETKVLIQSALDSLSNFDDNNSSDVMPAAIIDSEPHYSSENFIVYYPADSDITQADAMEVANYFEETKNFFVSQLGYRTPLLETGQTKYRVRLMAYNADLGDNFHGATFPENINSLTTASHIVIYQFTTFNDAKKETIAHEYFHAIQRAYQNTDTNKWFDEATANWAKIYKSGTSTTCDTQVQAYLNSTNPIYYNTSQGYGAVLFALTIQDICGVNAIKAIYEQYAEQTTNDLTFEEFKTDVIDEALDQYYNSFDGIFLRMARYNFAPSYFYANYHPGGATAVSSWTPRITDEVTPVVESRRPYYSTAVSNATVGCYSSNYYNLVPDETGKTSQLMVSVTVSGAGGRASFSYKTTNGTYQVGTMTASGTNTYTYTTESFGNIQEFCVIVSNVNADDGDSTTNESITYSITYHVNRGTSETVSIGSSHRYWEDISTLPKGEYKDYLITLSSGSQQLIQTFGAADTYLYVYDSNGNLLNNTSSCDDAGYGSNALVSMSFSSGVQYRVRVCFYSSSKTGDVRLSIIPTATYANFEAITTKTDNTSIVSTTLSGNASNVLAYKFTSPNEYVVNVSANADVYLYIIDPTSTAAAVSADNTNTDNTTGEDSLYNDDYNGTNQSQITKIFYANVTYLVIVAAYNPSTGSGTQYYLRFS